MSSARAKRWIKGEPKPHPEALTTDYWNLPSSHNFCDCPPMCIHAETCLTSPIYAGLVEELGSPRHWLRDLTIYTFISITKGGNRSEA
jgi:hypothetical protein